MGKSGRRLFPARVRHILGILLLSAASSVAADSGNIRGRPPEALDELPGARKLFEVRNASAPPRIVNHNFKFGEIVARFWLELSDDDVKQLARRAGAPRVTRLSPLGLFLIKGPPSIRATERIMTKLWETGAVVAIEPNYFGGRLAFSPNDPHFTNGNQWHLEQPSDIDLDLTAAWDITRGSPDVVIAATDTGIDIDHPEFAGRLFVNPGEIPGNGIGFGMEYLRRSARQQCG